MSKENKIVESIYYEKEYNENNFWNKIKKYAILLGEDLLEKALTLYYTLQDKDTPTKIKTAIIGALGYFILPLDAVPDTIAGLGFSDDLGVLALTISQISSYIKDEHIAKAKETLKQWFNEEK